MMGIMFPPDCNRVNGSKKNGGDQSPRPYTFRRPCNVSSSLKSSIWVYFKFACTRCDKAIFLSRFRNDEKRAYNGLKPIQKQNGVLNLTHLCTFELGKIFTIPSKTILKIIYFRFFIQLELKFTIKPDNVLRLILKQDTKSRTIFSYWTLHQDIFFEIF